MDDELMILTGDAYAEAFRERTGYYPRWVPSVGTYPGRLWVRFWRSY